MNCDCMMKTENLMRIFLVRTPFGHATTANAHLIPSALDKRRKIQGFSTGFSGTGGESEYCLVRLPDDAIESEGPSGGEPAVSPSKVPTPSVGSLLVAMYVGSISSARLTQQGLTGFSAAPQISSPRIPRSMCLVWIAKTKNMWSQFNRKLGQ